MTKSVDHSMPSSPMLLTSVGRASSFALASDALDLTGGHGRSLVPVAGAGAELRLWAPSNERKEGSSGGLKACIYPGSHLGTRRRRGAVAAKCWLPDQAQLRARLPSLPSSRVFMVRPHRVRSAKPSDALLCIRLEGRARILHA